MGWKATQCQLGCKLGSQVAPSKLETVAGSKSSWIWSIKLVCRWTVPRRNKWHQVKLDNVQWTPNILQSFYGRPMLVCGRGLVSFSKVLAIFPRLSWQFYWENGIVESCKKMEFILIFLAANEQV